MIKTIAHLADIHIRKLHRFVEYRQVFKKLYKQLKDLKPDAIYIGGDVVHGKLDTSPEEVRMVANFFLELCKIAPTIIIPGNHDCNLNNKSREDTLSPIIDLVKKITPNLHYWKKSGVYTMDNIDFGVMSIFDIDKEGKQITDNLPNPHNLDGDVRVALFHGGVDKHLYDNGFAVVDEKVKLKDFQGYDIVMLGDIHKRQFLDDRETVAYPGSLIQQNYSEEPSHGFLLWDVETKKATYHQVENDYGYKILKVEDGKILNSTTGKPFELTFMPPKGRVKIKFWDTSLEQIKDIQIGLRKQYPKLKEIVTERQDNISIGDDRENKLDIGDVRDINYQNELLEDFLKRNVDGIDENTIKRVQNINDLTNNSPEIYDGDITRNVDWKIKSFEFDNMFCYGKGNKIDFQKLDGTVGVVAPNHSGKSAIMDAIAYTIYDVCSRTNRALDVMNKKKTTFKARLNLEINGNDYFIERDAKYKRVNHKDGRVSHMCPVKVKFYMIDDSGEEVDLSGAARFNSTYGTGTNEEIKKVLGTFDDFILTSLSLQNNGMNFLDKKQAERKKILSTFMDIEVFEQLETIAKSDSNEERVMLRQFQKKDSYKELGTMNQRIIELEKDERVLSDKDKKIDDELFKLEDEKIKLVRKLYKIDATIETYDIWELTNQQNNLLNEQKNLTEKLKEDKEYKETLRPLYVDYHTKLAEIDEEKIQEDYQEYQDLKQKIVYYENLLNINESKIKSLRNHKADLDKFKYDENCEFCIKNGKEQIHEQEEIQNKINELKSEHSDISANYKVKSYALEKLGDVEVQKDEYDRFQDELTQIQHDAVKIGGKISTQETKLEHIKSELINIEEKIDKYYELAEKIEGNKKLNEEISKLTTEISSLQLESIEVDKKYKKILSTLSVAKNQKDNIEDDIQKLVDIEQKILDYDLYLLALSKDGIPYELISKAIPSIEREINYVLENMNAGFHIELEMKEKNIDAFICYGDDKWNLELSSGMERFVSSLAIRIGLINVSTLPRPNFIIVDEGFGTLDSDNIANMQGAFQYLRTQFDFTMVITHLDTIKDYMDVLIPIDVKSDGSKVLFN